MSWGKAVSFKIKNSTKGIVLAANQVAMITLAGNPLTPTLTDILGSMSTTATLTYSNSTVTLTFTTDKTITVFYVEA